jgi:hypothetical protein
MLLFLRWSYDNLYFTFFFFFYYSLELGERGTVTSRKVAVSIPEDIGIFIWPNPSRRIMTPRLTQPQTEISISNLPGGKARLALKADSVTAICELTKKKAELRGFSLPANYTDRATAAFQRDQPNGSPRPYSPFSRPGPLLFLRSSSSFIFTRLNGPRSRPTTSQKIW